MSLLHDIPMLAAGLLLRHRVGVGSFLKIEAEGRDRLPDPPFLICANHASHGDYNALVEALGMAYRDVIAIAAADLHFDSSWRSRLLRRYYNLAPLDRDKPAAGLRSCTETCRQFLAKGGKAVILYPEGTRTPDGAIHPFKRGLAPIVRGLGLNVVPAHVEGGYRLYSRHHLLPRPGRMTVRFGAPMDFKSVTGTDPQGPRDPQAEARFVAEIEQAVRALDPGVEAD